MEWTDIRLTVSKADAEAAEAVATMIAEGGIYIEDYSDIEEQVEQIAHVDLIEQELLDKPRDTVIIHMYLEPGASPVETLALIAARMEAADIPYTSETEGVEQEDWQNGWRKYYHPMDVGQRLAIVPSWQDYDTDRVKLILDPGLAFGTGGHETTNLCLEVLDERVKGGERVLDIGTGSGILAIAALKLGAAVAEGVDIDPVAVRTAGENAALNGVADKLTVLGRGNFNILGTDDNINRSIPAESLVNTFKLFAENLNSAVIKHNSVENICLTDKVCNKCVHRLVVYILGRTNLLDYTVVHNNNTVAHGQSLFLIVSNIDKGDSERLMHFLQLHLHILAHLEVKSRQRFVQQEHFRFVHDSSGIATRCCCPPERESTSRYS